MDRRRTIGFLAIAVAFVVLARGVADAPLAPPPLPAPGAAILAEPGVQVELALPDLEGEPRRAADWSGQIVLLNFWATWCEPCRDELPALETLHRTLADEGLVVVGVSVDTAEPDRIAGFLRAAETSFPNLHDRGGERAQQLGVRAYPTTLLLDRAGRLRLAVPSAWDWAHPDALAWLRAALANEAYY